MPGISFKLLSVLALLLITVGRLDVVLAQAPQGKPLTIRGKIAAIEKGALKITTAAGDVLVKHADDVRIGGVETAKLSDISPGITSGHRRQAG